MKGNKTWIETIGDKKYVVEPIGDLKYIIGDEEGKFRLVTATRDNKEFLLEIEEGKNPITLEVGLDKTSFSFRPDESMIKQINDGLIKKIKPENMYNSLVNFARQYLDLKNDHDYLVLALYVYQTYKIDNLSSVFLLSIDGDRNVGKTSVLEFLDNICYRYNLTKNITGAGLMRLVEREGLNVGFDELDELTEQQKDDVMSILRGSQRRNNKAIRLVKTNNDFVPQHFDVFGSHAFSYRGTVEDALDTRTLSIQMKRTDDNTYSVVSAIREKQLYGLRNLLFYHRLYNYLINANKKEEFFEQFIKKDTPHDRVITRAEAKELRRKNYDILTEHLSPEVKSYLNKLFGRTAELYLVVVNLAKSLDLNINNLIEQAFNKKVALMDAGYTDLEYHVKKWLLEHYALITQIKEQQQTLTNPSTMKDFTAFKDSDGYHGILKKDFLIEITGHLKKNGYPFIDNNKILKVLKQFGFSRGDKNSGGNYGISQRIDGVVKKVVVFDQAVLDILLKEESKHEL
jgi:hypothetical protein